MLEQTQRCLEKLPLVTKRTGKGRTSIYEGIKDGTFPAPVRIGDRAVAWDSFAIDRWIEEKIENAERATANNDSSSMYSDGAGNSSKKVCDVQSDVQGGKL